MVEKPLTLPSPPPYRIPTTLLPLGSHLSCPPATTAACVTLAADSASLSLGLHLK